MVGKATLHRPTWCFICLREPVNRLPSGAKASPSRRLAKYMKDYGMLAGYFWISNFVYSIQNVFHCQGKIWEGSREEINVGQRENGSEVKRGSRSRPMKKSRSLQVLMGAHGRAGDSGFNKECVEVLFPSWHLATVRNGLFLIPRKYRLKISSYKGLDQCSGCS